MAIIVAGKLIIKPELRDEFITKSQESIQLARSNTACEDFSVSPDSIDSNRVNVFEKWQSYTALKAFRDSGPDSDLFTLVESFEVKEYEVNSE